MTLEEVSKLMESKKQTVIIDRSIDSLSLLGVAFVVMKVLGTITWSWWWVLAPFWIPAALALILALIILGCITYIAITAGTAIIDEHLEENVKEAVTEGSTENIKEAVKNTSEVVQEKPKKKPSRKRKPKVNDNGESNPSETKGKND